MENFIAYNPVKLHFGKGVATDVGTIAAEFGKKVLLVYGQGSAVRYGYLDFVRKNLTKAGLSITEYGGIKPNPVIDDVDKAASLGRKNKVEVVVAVGGGSTIDSSKIIADCIAEDVPGWDIMSHKHTPSSALPLLVVLTLAATGTEMNNISVLQNQETQEKIGFSSPHNYPRHSFLDPEFTYTVPRNYTAFGIVDLIAHCLEAYFGKGEANLSDRFVYAIIREAMEVGPKVLKEPTNYDTRARVMWAATNALNGLTLSGRKSGDWGVHAISHILSFLYDAPHGATLSIAYPAWFKLQSERIPDRISQLGRQLFNVSTPATTIEKFRKLFVSLGSPANLSDIGIDNSQKSIILDLMIKNRVTGDHHILSEEDYLRIINYMM
jgi:alcohol dehydrogenase YqhD (iron-dependent ADH family)